MISPSQRYDRTRHKEANFDNVGKKFIDRNHVIKLSTSLAGEQRWKEDDSVTTEKPRECHSPPPPHKQSSSLTSIKQTCINILLYLLLSVLSNSYQILAVYIAKRNLNIFKSTFSLSRNMKKICNYICICGSFQVTFTCQRWSNPPKS